MSFWLHKHGPNLRISPMAMQSLIINKDIAWDKRRLLKTIVFGPAKVPVCDNQTTPATLNWKYFIATVIHYCHTWSNIYTQIL